MLFRDAHFYSRLLLLSTALLLISGCGAGLCIQTLACPATLSRFISADAVEMDAGTISLRWNPASLTRSESLVYSVYYSASDNLTTLDETKTNGTRVALDQPATTYTLSGMALTQPYYFNIIAKDETGMETLYISRGPYCDGTGTPAAPYLICDRGSLQLIALELTTLPAGGGYPFLR